jgi:hypothetical protein
MRTLHDRLKIIEKIEKNPGEKHVDIAKWLGFPASTLNTIFAKKNDIREQIQKCGNACKKRKMQGVYICWNWNGALHADVYEGVEKVKAFFYAHSVTDSDCEHILGLEKSYFQLRQNSAKKQKTVYHFFC